MYVSGGPNKLTRRLMDRLTLGGCDLIRSEAVMVGFNFERSFRMLFNIEKGGFRWIIESRD